MYTLPISIAFLVISFLILNYSTDYFVRGLGVICKRFEIPGSIVGATIAAMGSSAPEFGTSVFSVVAAHPAIGLGTIIGSAIFNITLLIAISVWIRGCSVSRDVLHRDGLFYLLAVLITIICMWDGKISRYEAISWTCLYVVYLAWLIWDAKRKKEEFKGNIEIPSNMKGAVYLVGGLLFIILAAGLLVRSTITITGIMGIPESLFSLVIIAIGTSISDLFISIHAARNGMGSLAISNAIGSNTFDILACLGIPLSFRAETTVVGDIGLSMPYLLGSFLIFLLLVRIGWHLNKKDAYILFAVYAVYIAIILLP
ncbi:MAG: calcium/sodium antiporter [Methanophagales archaeon]|nr:calcium/sodium antiporter [Methanophagales archaeon]MCW3141216.1 calcium/sodium antiporter [Methanophagales archaeon]